MRSFALSLVCAAMLWPTGLLQADDLPPVITWKKTVVDKKFRAEGVAVADVNRDGKMDILTGEVWYEAPNWTPHEIRASKRDYGNGFNGYSESFSCWAEDVNGDGWPDLIVIGFPGAPCFWYENPQGKDGHWKEHVIWHSACNETPIYADLFGNGKRVLVMGWQPKENNKQGTMGQMAWFAPGKDPNQLWEMHPISEPSQPGKEIPGTRQFSHGLGVTDVNGDGRLDVVCTGGWWEQPAERNSQPWKFHPANIGEACADMFAYDVDGDGKNDIIASSAHKFGIWWYKQRPGSEHPSFEKHDLFKDLVSETHALHFVDINGDGLKDLVTGKRWWSHGRNEPGADAPAVIYWFENQRGKDGMTKFVPRLVDNDSGIGVQFVVADVNGDKLPDIVTANKKGVFLFEQVRGLTTPLKTGTITINPDKP
jgi:FG-GAP-like repeat